MLALSLSDFENRHSGENDGHGDALLYESTDSNVEPGSIPLEVLSY
jgi:hypothetical protein